MTHVSCQWDPIAKLQSSTSGSAYLRSSLTGSKIAHRSHQSNESLSQSSRCTWRNTLLQESPIQLEMAHRFGQWICVRLDSRVPRTCWISFVLYVTSRNIRETISDSKAVVRSQRLYIIDAVVDAYRSRHLPYCRSIQSFVCAKCRRRLSGGMSSCRRREGHEGSLDRRRSARTGGERFLRRCDQD